MTAKNYAISCHRATNHLYNNFPYEVHLEMVVNVAMDFIHLIPEEERECVIAACWCHDLIEDCRQTYNDVARETNPHVAEIVYALTNEKGRNRKERGNSHYYEGIRETPYATFVKLCDRIANYEYSKNTGSHMVKMYEKEIDEFILDIYDSKYQDMFVRLRDFAGEEK